MPRITANGIQLEYEATGDPTAPPILLIMGLASQLTRWPEPFHRALTEAGFYVIRFDNRDIGLSTWFDHAGRPPLGRAALRAALGLPVSAPYLLDDMARDALGLLDALGLASAHVVGVSMGGMIGQILAARHGARVRTLTSIMSTSGDPKLPQPDLKLRAALIRRPSKDASRWEQIEGIARIMTLIGSPGFPPDPQVLRQQIGRDVDRSYHPVGMGRQLLAILASGSRTPILGQITAPTLILHGAADPLVPVASAYDLQRRIRGAKLEVFAGMGHDMPAALLPALTGHILEHIRGTEAGAPVRSSAGS